MTFDANRGGPSPAPDSSGTWRPGAGRRGSRRPASIAGRSLGFGAATGAGIGFVIVLFLSAAGAADPGGVGGLGGFFAGVLFVGPYAVGLGAMVGVACGFVACIPLLLAQECARATTRHAARGGAAPGIGRTAAGLIGGAGAALPPLGFAIRNVIAHGTGAAVLLFWFAAVAFLFGMLLGPYVVYGARVKRGTRPRSSRLPGHDRPAGADRTEGTDGPDLRSAQ